MISFFLLLAGPAADQAGSADKAPARLKLCPDSPNCVSSTADDPGRRIEPFPPAVTPAITMALLVRVLETFPRTTIVVRSERYIMAEVRTLLGFVDDVEFLLDAKNGPVQARSASRIGYWDLGVNRRRMEAMRKVYLQLKESS